MASAHQSKDQPDWTSAQLVPSFIRRLVLSAIAFVSGTCGVDASWRNSRSWSDLYNSLDPSVYTYCGVHCGPRNRRNAFLLSVEFFEGAGKDCVHLVNKSNIVKATVSPCREVSSASNIMWSPVMESANFAGFGRLSRPPCAFLF